VPKASDTGLPPPKTTKAKKRKNRRNYTRIACWNITSWTKRDQEVIQELDRHRIDICGIAETKKKGKGSARYNNYILIYSGKCRSERAHSGVGILLNEKYEHTIKDDIDYVSDRILRVTLSINNTSVHLISIYAPDICKPREETEEFYNKLQDTIEHLPSSDKVIILGDFNARIGKHEIQGIKQRFNEDVLNENGVQLIDFCSRNEMRINNTFYPHKEQHKYTFINTRNQKSTIDYIITNRQIHPSQISDVRALTSANVGTDHHLILCKLKMAKPPKKLTSPKYIEKYNLEALDVKNTHSIYQNTISHKIANNQIKEENNVEEAWSKIRKNIDDAAEEILGKRKINTNAVNRKTPWFTDEVKQLAEEKRKSYLSYRSSPTTAEYKKYVQVRNRVNSQISRIKKNYWKKFTEDMEKDLYGAQKKVWKMLRNRKKPINELIQTKSITIEQWESYFKELYNDNSEKSTKTLPTNEKVEITETETARAIKKLKNRKSPGIDNIPNELIKYAGTSLATEINRLFNKILETTSIPNEWRTSVTIPIFKKGQKFLPENYRGISLLCSTLKLLTSILRDKMESIITNREEQQGFRSNRSTTDAIFILRQVREKSLEYNTPAFLCFVDLTKAFDRVKLKDVIDILIEQNVPSQVIKLVQELNTDSSTKIRVNGELSNTIATSAGIRQGDSLSPFLFNLIMDRIIEEVVSLKVGYRLGKESISVVCYADDAVLLAESQEDLQNLLNKFEEASKKYNMQISIGKTKSMVISKIPSSCNLVVEGQPIGQENAFKYLGVDVSSQGDLTNETVSQVLRAARIQGCLKDAIWKNKHMKMESKIRIYKTCVRPILTYGIESRADTTKTKSLLRVSEMKTLRTICGVTLRDRVRNTEIRRRCDVQDVVRWGRQRRRQWNEHVRRMDAGRLAKITLQGVPTGKRPPGRPPKRWRDSWSSVSQEEPTTVETTGTVETDLTI
jgi:endonuclease/exonuclease/phosphatase family metal-dependent hydrolase